VASESASDDDSKDQDDQKRDDRRGGGGGGGASDGSQPSSLSVPLVGSLPVQLPSSGHGLPAISLG
jgi:hypothetical protein